MSLKGLHNGPKGLHNGPKGLHNGPKGLHNGPKGLHLKYGFNQGLWVYRQDTL